MENSARSVLPEGFDMPKGQPLKVGLASAAWTRQVLAVAETIDGDFAACLGDIFLVAEERQAKRMRGEDPGPLPEIPKRSMEWENRVVVTLLRVLPGHQESWSRSGCSGEDPRD